MLKSLFATLLLLASLWVPMSTGQPQVQWLSPAQQQGEVGVGIMTMSGHPPVVAVVSGGHHLE